ncbi:MAG: dATP/dGTP diphosphohydrolase domain-containing protein [Phycisphaeraceae bacterium]
MTLPTDNKARKDLPIATGVFDYFPDALAAVAEISRVGNDKHNPGQPLHWARDKSSDHADCIARHLFERGELDSDGGRHSAKLAWRALALLQVELENACIATLSRGSTTERDPTPTTVSDAALPSRPDDHAWFYWFGDSETPPVPDDTVVEVKFRNGEIGGPSSAGGWDWGDTLGDWAILSYRIVKSIVR